MGESGRDPDDSTIGLAGAFGAFAAEREVWRSQRCLVSALGFRGSAHQASVSSKLQLP
jgi:hypothetical protein